MKNFFTLCLLLFAISKMTSAQQATVKVEFVNNPKATYRLHVPKYSLRSGVYNNLPKSVKIESSSSSFTVFLKEPTFVMMYCYDPQKEGLALSYQFYLSPNDNLVFKADLSDLSQISVTGQGSQNNQPLIAGLKNLDTYGLTGDSIPNRIMEIIKKEDSDRKSRFKEYLNKFKPSADFITNWNYEIEYFAPSTFYYIKENSKFGENSKAYNRNYNTWAKTQDSLFSKVSLNNEKAIHAPQYLRLINWYILREKERIWKDIRENPVEAYKTWYDADTVAGKQLHFDDQSNQLQERIINKSFTGKVADYAYAILLESAIAESNPKNLVGIYKRYQQSFPNSIYRPWFEEKIEQISAREKQTLNEKMIFLPNNGYEITSFEQILTMFKGKTVLLDMWGTWCGPCREEIEKNGAEIKLALKDKGIDYLYIANYDDKSEKKWKELIAYFKLEGTHVLANKTLSDDIMNKTKGQGYPTYVVIKKDGTYELSNAGYPMDRNILIKQLLDAASLP